MGDNGGHDLIFLSLFHSSSFFFTPYALETRNEEVGRVGPRASLDWIGATG